MRIVVVHNKNTLKPIQFTLGKWGEIIITSNMEYNLDDLIVSLLEVDSVEELDNRYFVHLMEEKNG